MYGIDVSGTGKDLGKALIVILLASAMSLCYDLHMFCEHLAESPWPLAFASQCQLLLLWPAENVTYAIDDSVHALFNYAAVSPKLFASVHMLSMPLRLSASRASPSLSHTLTPIHFLNLRSLSAPSHTSSHLLKPRSFS